MSPTTAATLSTIIPTVSPDPNNEQDLRIITFIGSVYAQHNAIRNSYGSPSTGWDWPNAFYVISSGSLDMEWAVTRSYGQSSPDMSWNDIPQRSYHVYGNGNIDEEHAEVLFSYGHKNTGVKS